MYEDNCLNFHRYGQLGNGIVPMLTLLMLTIALWLWNRKALILGNNTKVFRNKRHNICSLQSIYKAMCREREKEQSSDKRKAKGGK